MLRNNYLVRAARKTAGVGRVLLQRSIETLRKLWKNSKLDVSVIVVVCNMPREAPRTLYSLSASHQRHIQPKDYEVIVVDNGSSPPLDRKVIEGLTGNFRLIRIEHTLASPGAALNLGLTEARGNVIGVMIDGARIATPGFLHFARHGSRVHRRSVVAALGWYLGYDYQRFARQAGYDQTREDGLLASIDWPQDGYRLFEIATMDESSVNGWLAPISGSNGLFLSREMWDLLGGLDESFYSPGGGGAANLDTFRRAIEVPGSELVLLLGEGTFRQLHGGAGTNTQALRGQRYNLPKVTKPPTYIGTLAHSALARFVRSALHPLPYHVAPLGSHFDSALWSITPPVQSSNPVAAALIDLAHTEFRAGRYSVTAAIARLIREHAPDEPEPQRLLSLVAAWNSSGEPPSEGRADYYVAIGEAHRRLGENDAAAANYRAALDVDPNIVRAHIGLATLRTTGDFYYTWIDRLYTTLKPETIIEIGVAEGASLAYARPPTLAIGVDPNPKVMFPLKTNTLIFVETSDEFFAQRRPDSLLAGRPLGVGFIDGLHLYEQVLRDFINLEKYCGHRSVILIHDTMPLDERTQRRTRDTQFHTGDVWKIVLCLKRYRPELDVFTIATPWTGLTVVTGLNPASSVLAEKYDEAVAHFIDTPYSEIENRLDTALNIVSNEWSIVRARLAVRHFL